MVHTRHTSPENGFPEASTSGDNWIKPEPADNQHKSVEVMHDCERCEVGKSTTSDRLCPRCREFIDMRTKWESQYPQLQQLADALVMYGERDDSLTDDELNQMVDAIRLARRIIAAREAG